MTRTAVFTTSATAANARVAGARARRRRKENPRIAALPVKAGLASSPGLDSAGPGVSGDAGSGRVRAIRTLRSVTF
jgi:hypothetical protein